jgi:hypothetical protein
VIGGSRFPSHASNIRSTTDRNNPLGGGPATFFQVCWYSTALPCLPTISITPACRRQ